MKTSELIGPALDWAVAKCEGLQAAQLKVNGPVHVFRTVGYEPTTYQPTEKWNQAGPIIEREIYKLFRNVGGTFTAQIKIRVPYYSPTYGADIGRDEVISCAGPTPLIAAMRCYVASRLGDEVEIPSELQP